MTLDELAQIATILGVAVGLTTLFFVAYQARLGAKTNRANFWLKLEEMFSRHDGVYLKLHPGGEWTEKGRGPTSTGEWAKVSDYMGLFEHCIIMLEKRLIDWKTFQSIYAYRIPEILSNQTIIEETLVKDAKYWADFLRLARRLEVAEKRAGREFPSVDQVVGSARGTQG